VALSFVAPLLILSLRAPSFFAPAAFGLPPLPKVGAFSFDTLLALSSCSATEAVPKFAVCNFPESTTAFGGSGDDESSLGVDNAADAGGARTGARSSEDSSGELLGRLSSGAEIALPIAGKHRNNKK
jgi:hypothetical protein